ncbi:SigE family RNA polymerase sigma factor [Actinomadura alba]|uniref:SigE family RNA polymerase sigma factor n=1 Tax=Actinomadura alba TaxID=406431 RepID=UPI001C9C1A7E|nr:SigE family RNA polymerase sigma factor [Actinomadura alba]
MSETTTRASPLSDAAYTAFVEVAWDRHLRVATLLTGDAHRAEELLQDCLVELYVRWPRVSKSGDPHAYLRRMLVNGNVSWWRRRRRELLTAETPDRADPLSAPREPHEELRRALLALPRQQRAVVVLRHFDDLTEKAVAAALGCTVGTVGTVKSQHFRAMARLRELLHPVGLDEPKEAAL